MNQTVCAKLGSFLNGLTLMPALLSRCLLRAFYRAFFDGTRLQAGACRGSGNPAGERNLLLLVSGQTSARTAINRWSVPEPSTGQQNAGHHSQLRRAQIPSPDPWAPTMPAIQARPTCLSRPPTLSPITPCSPGQAHLLSPPPTSLGHPFPPGHAPYIS